MSVEHVLCVPNLLFRELGDFQGFSTNTRLLKTLLDPERTLYLPRDEAEADPAYKQLIPYCLLTYGGRVFHYARGTGGGEGRLHAKLSVGVGGHISTDDADDGDRTGERTYRAGMRRELEEEVELTDGWTDAVLGLINDDSTEVGRVHLGVVHRIDLKNPQVRPREGSIQDRGLADPHALLERAEALESWSRIALEHLFGPGSGGV